MGLNTKDAAASGMIMIVLTDFLDPTLLVTIKVTFRNPGVEYIWEGFLATLVDPSPKSQFQEIGLPVEASTNRTVCPAVGYLGPYVKATLTSFARAETRPAKKLFELAVVCAMVFVDMNWKQTTKGRTLAMSFITLRGGFGFLFMISFFLFRGLIVEFIMIREGSGEITPKGGSKGDMAGIVASQRGAVQHFDKAAAGILAAFNYLEAQRGRTDIRQEDA